MLRTKILAPQRQKDSYSPVHESGVRKAVSTLPEDSSKMREYQTKCPECLRRITLSMDVEDKRRNTDEFFMIECPHCKKEWYAKIFETLVTYPHKLPQKDEGGGRDASL